MMMMMMIAI